MKTKADCVIIGAGPAGLAAAIALKRAGVDDVLLLERNDSLGGILNQCIHVGFGLTYFGRNYTGPEYARALADDFVRSGVPCLLDTMVLEVTRGRVVKAMSKAEGYLEIEAGAVVVATGCRERTRDNLEIPGTRPAGVFTAGQAQDLINRRGFRIGERVLIQGSGDIGLIMARRLTIEGCEVTGVFERLPYLAGLIRNKVQCLDHFDIPLALGSQVCEIVGKRRVEGAWVERLDGNLKPIPESREFFPCDTILFSVGLIPEIDILRGAGVAPGRGGEAPVNSSFEIGGTGIFVAGNACHIHDLADNASREGEAVAARVGLFLRDSKAFAAGTDDGKPFKPAQPVTAYDDDFFEGLRQDGATVCIVCPRGCVVSEKSAGCSRGVEYFRESRHGRRQILTTSMRSGPGTCVPRIPLRSVEPVDVSDIPRLRAGLARIGAGGPFLVELAGRVVPFASAQEDGSPDGRRGLASEPRSGPVG